MLLSKIAIRSAVATVSVLSLLGSVTCTFEDDPERAQIPAVSEAEARALLSSAIEDATTKRFVVLCKEGAFSQHGGAAVPGCERIPSADGTFRYQVDPRLQSLAPLTPPEVVAVDVLPATTCTAPATVLRLAGIDANGAGYQSDFHVTRLPDGQLTVLIPVFWFTSGVGHIESEC